MTEKEYKEYIYKKADKVKTKKQLDELLNEVTNCEELDYGKIIYAISGCMLATANYIDNSEVGGITGFQASFIGWEMVKKFIHESTIGMKLVDYENMLYPQYKEHFQKFISQDTWESLQKQAEINLKEIPTANPKVIEHWKHIVRGKVPFGYKVEKN